MELSETPLQTARGSAQAKNSVIYLDYNATTPVLPEVREAVLPYLSGDWGNPASSYRFGAQLKSVRETAREGVADPLGASSPTEILIPGVGRNQITPPFTPH